MTSEKFNFVTFEDVGAKFGSYTISLGAHGGFGLNSGFYKKENIKQYSYVVLSYDENKNAVAFNFTTDSTLKGAWKITHTKTKHSASVVVRSFFAAHSINPEEYTGKYTPKDYNDPKIGRLFYITLKRKEKL